MVYRKAYEIAYALSRVAGNLGDNPFAAKMLEEAADIVSLAAHEEYNALSGKLSETILIIRFVSDINLMSQNNKDLIIEEIGNLESEINAIPEEKEITIADIFSGFRQKKEIKSEIESEIKLNSGIESEKESEIKPEMRQAAILERIRKMGNCRLGDIHSAFPEVSDRTIRYDLETLIHRDLVERIGTGGRSVYYRAKGNFS